jgi:hypothetical protein
VLWVRFRCIGCVYEVVSWKPKSKKFVSLSACRRFGTGFGDHGNHGEPADCRGHRIRWQCPSSCRGCTWYCNWRLVPIYLITTMLIPNTTNRRLSQCCVSLAQTRTKTKTKTKTQALTLTLTLTHNSQRTSLENSQNHKIHKIHKNYNKQQVRWWSGQQGSSSSGAPNVW